MTRVVHCMREPFDVYIGRPNDRVSITVPGANGYWGNPFLIGRDAGGTIWTRDQVVNLYEAWLLTNHPEMIERARQELRGKILGCWCAPLPCHGDVLLRIANQ